MRFLSLLRVETWRLFRDRLTRVIIFLAVFSPLPGLFSSFPFALTTTKMGAYLASPALAGAVCSSFLFAFLTVKELDRVHKYQMSAITDPIISPLLVNLVRINAIMIVAVITQATVMLVFLPYTLAQTGMVFNWELYVTVYACVMLPSMLLAILLSASAYLVTQRAEISFLLFLVFALLALTVWVQDYLLVWIKSGVWVLSDDFGNSRLMRSVIYSRMVWFFALGGTGLLSLMCVRRFGKGLSGSFAQNSRRHFFVPIFAMAMLVLSCHLYYAQPFLDHSAPEIDYNLSDPNENLSCSALYAVLSPDIRTGEHFGTITYSLHNTAGKPEKGIFSINPGYQVTSVTANGRSVPFVDLNNDKMGGKEISVTLPATEEIELVMQYGGFPREWNIVPTLGRTEIGKNYIKLVNQDFAPVPCNFKYDKDIPVPFTGRIILPPDLRPVLFGTGTTRFLTVNPDGTKTWWFESSGYRVILYAGDYISRKVRAAGQDIEFLYSAKHDRIMEKCNVTGMLKEVFEYCTAHYGPLQFYENNTLKLIELDVYQSGGYAGNGASVMDENCFSEDGLKDPLKGASGNEVMAHEIIHQWWGLNTMFPYDTYGDPWSSEGLTVYTTYRLMKELHGEPYAKANYVDMWQREVDDYKNNFYVRHPAYLDRLPDDFRASITNQFSHVSQYCLVPLKILKAEELVGGEEKIDRILYDLSNREVDPEYPYLTYDDFVQACRLHEEDLNID